jgi:hypothetical protein
MADEQQAAHKVACALGAYPLCQDRCRLLFDELNPLISTLER